MVVLLLNMEFLRNKSATLLVNFVEKCVNLLEMSLDFYSKERALFGATPMNKLELEFIDDTITAIQASGDKYDS